MQHTKNVDIDAVEDLAQFISLPEGNALKVIAHDTEKGLQKYSHVVLCFPNEGFTVELIVTLHHW